MKIVFSFAVAGCLGVLLPVSSRGSLIAYEGFSYSTSVPPDKDGDGKPDLHTQGAISGNFASAWSENTTSFYDYIQGGSLAFSNLITSGNSVHSIQSTDIATDLDRDVVNIPGTTGTELWASFLLRREAGTNNTFDVLAALVLKPSSGNAVQIGDTIGGLNYGLGDSGSASSNQSSVAAISGVTAFLVAKVSFLSGTDRIELFVNPAPGSTAPTTADATLNMALVDVDRIGYTTRNGSSREWTFDEIRLGTTFADVAPTPEPSAIALSGVGAVCLASLRRRRTR